MMNSLFTTFDPITKLLQINWMMMLIPTIILPMNFWMKKTRSSMMLKILENKIISELKNITHPKEILILTKSMFLMMIIMNIMGLMPYIFTPTSHMSISMSMALPMWIMLMMYGWLKFSMNMMAQRLPTGTPVMIMPMMIIIELTGNLIRPISLSVRLTANMAAGHLLMTLLENLNEMSINMMIIPLQMIMMTFEFSIAIIQSYVLQHYQHYILVMFLMNKNHPFHMVTPSPWSINTSMNSLTTIMGMINWIVMKQMFNLTLGVMMLTICSIMWWKDITRDSTFQGHHTKEVSNLMKTGMILFICSETLLFSSLFWTIFHSSLSPNIELGMNWPPKSTITFDPMQIPLLNTIILLSSGATITWAHQNLINNKFSMTNKSIKMTIMLGLYFSILQFMEYKESQFTISDSVYGSIFFLSTGFHGIHVIIWTSFILVCYFRMKNFHFSKNHHTGFELAALYWHFVDVVWLFLYVTMYWWSK